MQFLNTFKHEHITFKVVPDLSKYVQKVNFFEYVKKAKSSYFKTKTT